MQLSELAIVTTYAGPPVIGAFIGYVTNRIAIKMLFRPLKPWKVAGIRVPMTPGVIPSKRYALAENIGEMVGEHLLTSKEVGEALSREPFQEHLDQLVEKQLTSLLETKYDAVRSMIPEGYVDAFENVVNGLCHQLGERVHTYTCSQAGEEQIRLYVHAVVESLNDKPINSIVSSDSRTALYDSFGQGIKKILADEGTVNRLTAYFHSTLQKAAGEGKRIGELVPETAVTALQAKIKEQTPVLMRELGLRMGEPAVRKRIISGVIAGVDRFIDSLGPVGAMARGFIDMDSLETVINTYLTEKEEDILSWLQEPEVSGPVEEVLVGKVDEFLNISLADLIEKAGHEDVENFCRECVRRFTAMLGNGDDDSISVVLKQCIEAMLGNGDAQFSTLFSGGSGDVSVLQDNLSNEVLRFVQSDSGREGILRCLREISQLLTIHPIGSVSTIFTDDIVAVVKSYIIQKANRILLKEVPGLVKSLQISRLITEKVNSLDLLKLEGLLLSIMQEQFKYINLFGGLLGFIIGCVNLVLLTVM